MRIKGIRETSASLASPMRNAVIDFSKMTLSVVAVIMDAKLEGDRIIGFGFNSNGRYSQGGVLRERLIPRLLGADPDSLLDDQGILDPVRVNACMLQNEKPGGHGERAFAVGALDAAIWDAIGKAEGKPLYKIFAERFNDDIYDNRVSVYPGGGYYDEEKGIEGLKSELKGYLDTGYVLMKIKVGGAALEEDKRRIDAALSIVGEGRNLAVDANAALGIDEALRYANAMSEYELAWFEEPIDPLDFKGYAELAAAVPIPLATAENLFSEADAENLLSYGGLRRDCDWLQFDPSLCYGPTTFLNIVRKGERMGWSSRRHIPHGGHQLGLHLAAGLQLGGTETYPLVFQPFGGFGDEDEIKEGYINLPDAPGLGVEMKSELYNKILKPLIDG
tara:strand:- start:804 stop:1973 length:1170 start_codon:yes stop_codon:yes gene_type:complete